MRYISLTKSHFILVAFFLFFSSSSFATLKVQNEHFWEEWNKLIYYFDNDFKINNKYFLLSYDDPSPHNELLKYVEYINQKKEICKFPARYTLLKKFNIIDIELERCSSLVEYKEKAKENYNLKKKQSSVQCECGITYVCFRDYHIYRHINSKKHKNLLKPVVGVNS